MEVSTYSVKKENEIPVQVHFLNTFAAMKYSPSKDHIIIDDLDDCRDELVKAFFMKRKIGEPGEDLVCMNRRHMGRKMRVGNLHIAIGNVNKKDDADRVIDMLILRDFLGTNQRLIDTKQQFLEEGRQCFKKDYLLDIAENALGIATRARQKYFGGDEKQVTNICDGDEKPKSKLIGIGIGTKYKKKKMLKEDDKQSLRATLLNINEANNMLREALKECFPSDNIPDDIPDDIIIPQKDQNIPQKDQNLVFKEKDQVDDAEKLIDQDYQLDSELKDLNIKSKEKDQDHQSDPEPKDLNLKPKEKDQEDEAPTHTDQEDQPKPEHRAEVMEPSPNDLSVVLERYGFIDLDDLLENYTDTLYANATNPNFVDSRVFENGEWKSNSTLLAKVNEFKFGIVGEERVEKQDEGYSYYFTYKVFEILEAIEEVQRLFMNSNKNKDLLPLSEVEKLQQREEELIDLLRAEGFDVETIKRHQDEDGLEGMMGRQYYMGRRKQGWYRTWTKDKTSELCRLESNMKPKVRDMFVEQQGLDWQWKGQWDQTVEDFKKRGIKLHWLGKPEGEKENPFKPKIKKNARR